MNEKPGQIGVWLHGSSGRMGQEIQRALLEKQEEFLLLGGSSTHFEGEHFYQGQKVTPQLLAHSIEKQSIKLVLDFSTPQGNQVLFESFALGKLKGKAIIVGTTGISNDAHGRWKTLAEAHGHRLLVAPNTSIGILLIAKASLMAAGVCSSLGFDVEIVETHHRGKKDAPSGTAKFLANTITDGVEGLYSQPCRSNERQPGEVGVHSVRGGSVFGEHQVRIIGDSEEITISHTAFSRSLFAKGALVLSQWLLRKPAGSYELLDVDIGELMPKKP